MKLIIPKRILAATFVAALTLVAFSVPADTIKGAQRLMKPTPVADAAAVVPAKAHACAKCRDVAETVKLSSSKGVAAKTMRVAKDTCPTCNTRMQTMGQGKAAHSAAVHTCASGSTPKCCQ